MAGITTDRYGNITAEYKFYGLNNMQDPADLEFGECSVAMNVEFDNVNGFNTRSGKEFVGYDGNKSIFVASNGIEYTSSKRTSYCECGNGWIVFTDGDRIGYFDGFEEFDMPESIGIYDDGTDVAVIETERMPIPSGTFVCWYNGLLYVLRYEELVNESWLYYTDAYDLGTVDAKGNWFRFSGQPTMLEAAVDGLWVGAGDKVYALTGGGPEEMKERIVANYPCVAWTAVPCRLDKIFKGQIGMDRGVIFTTTQGMCIGGNNGKLTNMSLNKVSVKQAKEGAAYLREDGGLLHYIVCLHDTDKQFNKYVSPQIEVEEK